MQQPAVSVIIPMFNAQRYIAECLDSLLAQTLTNFEVIVMDDCSTDNSFAIVESYRNKFGERLKPRSMKKNSGGAGEPRNKGLEFSCGEYVFFMDSDDVLIPSGLKEMYTLAKQFDADAVYCERYFMSSGIGQDFINNVHLADDETKIQAIPPVDVPLLETDDIAVRVNKATEYHYWVTPWLRLVARNLLIDNDIKFPSLIGSNDVAWTFKVLFCAERFLRIPNPCYIWRMHESSTTLRKRTPEQEIHKWMDRTIRSLKEMDNFLAELDFFKKNPACRYQVINSFIERDIECIFGACLGKSPFEVYNIFREKFGTYLGEHDVLVAGLCTLANMQQRVFAVCQQKIYTLQEQSQKRIDELENEIWRLKNKE